MGVVVLLLMDWRREPPPPFNPAWPAIVVVSGGGGAERRTAREGRRRQTRVTHYQGMGRKARASGRRGMKDRREEGKEWGEGVGWQGMRHLYTCPRKEWAGVRLFDSPQAGS